MTAHLRFVPRFRYGHGMKHPICINLNGVQRGNFVYSCFDIDVGNAFRVAEVFYPQFPRDTNKTGGQEWPHYCPKIRRTIQTGIKKK